MNKAHTEGENRKPSRLRFFLRLVLSIAVIAYCVFLNIKRCSITAFADTFSLTPAETLAYYGLSFDGVYFNALNNQQVNVTFDYVGLSTDFVPDDSANPNFFYYDYLFDNQAGSVLYPAQASERPFLRYICRDLIYNDTASGSDVASRYFYSSGSANINQYNFTLHPAFEITHIDSFKQMILVPVRSDINRTEPNTYPNRRGSYIARTSIANVSGNMIAASNSNIPYFVIPYFKPQSALDFPPVESFSPPYSSTEIYMASFSFDDLNRLLPSSYTDFTFTGLDFKWNWSGAILDTALLGTSLGIEIWIQCPEITGISYSPPVVTTAPVTTTAPSTTRPPYTGEPSVTTPVFTYNLLPIESNQQVQIDIMNENLAYNAGTFEGINIIIKQLDDIYNAIKASGKLTVDQINGLEWNTRDMSEYVGNVLTSYTMPSMDFRSMYRPFTGFKDIFDGYPFLNAFAVLGGISLAFGTFCWFVFRGRGGS